MSTTVTIGRKLAIVGSATAAAIVVSAGLLNGSASVQFVSALLVSIGAAVCFVSADPKALVQIPVPVRKRRSMDRIEPDQG